MKKTHYETKILSLLSSFSRRRESMGNKALLFSGSSLKSGMTAESGRSMVEMLGVLAIVGVISIGGVAGYNYGMNRYRTNELLDGANKRAYTVATQLSTGLTPNLTEFKEYDATAGGTFKSDVTEWENGEFGIKVEGVKKEVCENILRMIGDNTPLRALSKGEGESEQELQSGGCEDGDTNAFSFVYNVEMLSKGAEPSSTGGGLGGNYCATHDGECNLNCGEGTNNCVNKYAGEATYDDVVSACGGAENIVTVADLGCVSVGSKCLNAPDLEEGLGYYLAGTLPGYSLPPGSGFGIMDGNLFVDDLSLPSDGALCK